MSVRFQPQQRAIDTAMKIKAILEGMEPPARGLGTAPPPSHGVIPYKGTQFPFDRLIVGSNFLIEPEKGEEIRDIQRKVSAALVRFCRAKCRRGQGIHMLTRQVEEKGKRYVMVYRDR
jgi:hypothetical protein